jgi:hypothetical protein
MHDQQAGIVARHHSHSQTGEQRTGMIGRNYSKVPQPLTPWRVKDRHDQQARIAARHYKHSQTGEPRTGMISRLELQQGTTATNILESQGQA